MSKDWLRDAGDEAARAADAADAEEPAERLRNLAEQLRSLADRSRGPDHGRLARIESILDEVEAEAGEAAAEHVREVKTQVVRYRETVDGV